MRITLDVDIERQDGKQMSSDLVADELTNTLLGETVDVEDSIYEVISVEAVPRKTQVPSKLGPLLSQLSDTYFKARPVIIGEHDDLRAGFNETERVLDNMLMHFLTDKGVNDLILKERIRESKKGRTNAR